MIVVMCVVLFVVGSIIVSTALFSVNKQCSSKNQTVCSLSELMLLLDCGMVREQLADLIHQQWSEWMRYLFENSVKMEGSVIIPTHLVLRWKRQMVTTYRNLPKDEQESDLEQADLILDLILKKHHHKKWLDDV